MLFARLQDQYRQDGGIRNYVPDLSDNPLPFYTQPFEGQHSLSQSANLSPLKEPVDTSYPWRSLSNPYLELNELTHTVTPYLFDPL
jgi:hypothetical protein